MIFRSDNPGRDFDRWDAWKEAQRIDRPWCDHCRKPIEEEKWIDFDGFIVCTNCLENHYTKTIECVVAAQ